MILEDNLTWSLFYSVLLDGWSISPGRKKKNLHLNFLKIYMWTCTAARDWIQCSEDWEAFAAASLPWHLPMPLAPKLPLQERVCDASLLQGIVVFLSLFLPGSWHNFCMEKRDLIEREMPSSPDALGILSLNAPSPDVQWVTTRWSTLHMSCNLAADHRALPTA